MRGWNDDALRRWYDSRFVMPSDALASGETLSTADFGLSMEFVEEGEAGTACTGAGARAVVAIAFAFPGVPTNGIRPAEKRDDVDIRDAREPDLNGIGAGAPWVADAV